MLARPIPSPLRSLARPFVPAGMDRKTGEGEGEEEEDEEEEVFV